MTIDMWPTLLGLLASLLVPSIIALPTNQDLGLHVIRPKRSIDLTLAHSLHKDDQLEKTIEPTGYKLELEPYIEDGVFKGRVKINVTWLEDSDEISLHSSHDLEISECEVKMNTVQSARKNLLELQKLTIKSSEMDLKKPIYNIKLNKAVPKGTTGHIDLNFTGNLETQSTKAFFKSCYDTSNRQTSTVVATQLRPNNARRLFPCFDEPGYKTPFELSVVRPKNMIALSNTPVRFTEEITGEPLSVWDHFEKTPPMSTFTLGLVIADLKVLDNKTVTIINDNGKKIDIRIWGRQEFFPALAGVTDKAERVFKEITEFWNMSLPLTKLDLVALPSYQGVKPADNWGLIVFKESELGGRGYYQLATELMYQWVGALVTPEWWSEINVNKALVGYLAAATSLKIDGGSEMVENWPMTVLYPLYYEFSKRYPHSRITGMKQETACFKIELIFRMFNYTLGENTFRKGLRMFLKEKQYKTFTGQDVWKYINVAALEDGKMDKDISIVEVVDTWISNDRLPMVSIERNYNTKTALASQKVYLRERPHDVPGQEKMLWWIPLITVDQSELDFSRTVPRAWIRKYRDVNLLGMPNSDKFVIVNPEEIGPFPVNYDVTNWNLLANYLQSESRTKIPVLTRAKILHDAWNLAYAGDLGFATALNMTLFLKYEKNHVVWEPVFTMIDHIGRHIDSSEVHKKFEAYVRTILTPLYEELGSHKEDEESWKTNLRGLCKTFLCRAGYKPCIEEAQAVYKTWMDAENPDEGNPISNQYICPVFKWGSQGEWDFGLQRVIHFPSTRKASERTYLLKTLAGCPVHTEKIIKLLNITVLDGNGNFTDNDIYLIFSMLAGGSRGYNALFHFLDVNWDAIRQRFENKTNLWDNLISSATSVFTTQEGLDMVTKLYRDHRSKFGSAEHIVEKSLKNIREETKWSDENLPVIELWLDQYLDMFQLEDNMFVGYDS